MAVKLKMSYLKDLAERVGSSFVEGALSVGTLQAAISWTSSVHDKGIVDWSAAEKIGITAAGAGLTAVFTLIKGLLARKRGDADSASLVTPTE